MGKREEEVHLSWKKDPFSFVSCIWEKKIRKNFGREHAYVILYYQIALDVFRLRLLNNRWLNFCVGSWLGRYIINIAK